MTTLTPTSFFNDVNSKLLLSNMVQFRQRLELPGSSAVDFTVDGCLYSDKPILLYVHGYRSTIDGTKAHYFKEQAADRGVGWLALGLPCHEGSTMPFNSFRISHCVAALQALVVELKQPLVLLGSSLGGWISSVVATQLHPRAVSARSTGQLTGLVMIAPAFDFIEYYFAQMQPDILPQWQATGSANFTDAYDGSEYQLDYEIISDSLQYGMLSHPCVTMVPMQIVHGADDEIVPVRLSERFVSICNGAHVALEIIPNGDHSLNSHLAVIAKRCFAFLD